MDKEFKLKKGFVVNTQGNQVVLVWENRQYGPYKKIDKILEGDKIVVYSVFDDVYISGKRVRTNWKQLQLDYVAKYGKQEYIFISGLNCYKWWTGIFTSTGRLIFKFSPAAFGDIDNIQFLRKGDLFAVFIESINPYDDRVGYVIGHSESEKGFKPALEPYKLVDIVELSSGRFAYVYQPRGYVQGGKRLVIETESVILKLSKEEKYQINQDSIVIYKKNGKVVEVKLGG